MVDAEAISRAEFEFEQTQHRAAVAGEFARRSEASASKGSVAGAAVDPGDEGFWAASTDPASPSARLRARAMDTLVRLAVERALVREQGVPYPADYAELLASLERENERRAARTGSGGVVFGPRRFSLAAWRDHVHSNALIELKRRLVAKGVLAPAEEAIAAGFEKWKREGVLRPKAKLEDCREGVRTHLIDEAFAVLVAERRRAAKNTFSTNG